MENPHPRHPDQRPGHALSFPVDVFRFTSVFLFARIILEKSIPKKGGKSAFLLV
jgi:hypothetical protein